MNLMITIFNGYNNKTAKCECGIKNERIVISNIDNQDDIFKYNFDNNNNDMIAMKCYNTLFTKNGLIKNIGSYILLSIIFIIIVSGILFYKFGYVLLEDIIKVIINNKEEKNNIKNINIKETIDIKSKGKDKIKTKGQPPIKIKDKRKSKINDKDKIKRKGIKNKKLFNNENKKESFGNKAKKKYQKDL